MLFLIRLIVFLSAFLLFTLEFIIGKIFLSAFGGSYLIWGGCLVFFQLVLLLGYKYAQVISERCDLKKYRIFHCAIIFLPFLFFPAKNIPFEYPAHNLPLIVSLMYFLTLTIGCVFFVLSTASTIWQSYLSVSDLPGRSNPYILFSVSNCGSFIALLAYPFVFELFFDLYQMQMFWLWCYVGTVALQCFIFWRLPLRYNRIAVNMQTDKRCDPFSVVVAWVSYSAAGVVLFMATTNIITLDITPMPLLWMLPLAIYLLSFYLNFKNNPFTLPITYRFIEIVIGVSFVFFIFSRTYGFDAIVAFGGFIIFLFFLSMFVQHRLYALRPHKHRLGKFYFYISLGGLLGGVCVSWVAPLLSTALVEFPAGLLLVVVGLICEGQRKKNHRAAVAMTFWVIMLFVWPQYYENAQIADFAVIAGATALVFLIGMRGYGAMAVALCVVIVFLSVLEGVWDRREYIARYRNYYGIGKIYEDKGVRYFEHGSIIHGAEFIDPEKKGHPLTYYHLASPVGEYLTDQRLKTENIAAIGLGIGVLSTYMWPDQNLDYYELERDVYTVANNYFSFLPNARGSVNVIFGDARQKLCSSSKKYGLIIEDAFSGDAIPVHLLTKEALSCYRDRLENDGVLLFHMSNKYIDSGLGLIRTALTVNAHAAFQFDKQDHPYLFSSNWIAITWDKERYEYLLAQRNWRPVDTHWIKEKSYVLSDSYSSLLPFIKWREIGIRF